MGAGKSGNSKSGSDCRDGRSENTRPRHRWLGVGGRGGTARGHVQGYCNQAGRSVAAVGRRARECLHVLPSAPPPSSSHPRWSGHRRGRALAAHASQPLATGSRAATDIWMAGDTAASTAAGVGGGCNGGACRRLVPSGDGRATDGGMRRRGTKRGGVGGWAGRWPGCLTLAASQWPPAPGWRKQREARGTAPVKR